MGRRTTAALLVYACIFSVLLLAGSAADASPYTQWSRGPSPDPNYFPIGVWAQAPRPDRVAAYSGAGFNLFISISWDKTDAGMTRLWNAGMQIILPPDHFVQARLDNPVFAGWLQRDEPDNARSNPDGGWYSPIPPFEDTPWNTCPPEYTPVYTRYQEMKAIDDTRPVLLNLSMGVAYDPWIGRGIRTNHPEDYADYIQGCDIVSFDIYPAASGNPDVKGKIWLVAAGVKRLVSLAAPGQVVWNFVECTDIHGHGKATPQEVKAEVWMSLIHGSMGILYFVHQIGPNFIEPGLLHDPIMLAAVSAINWEVRSLAPALNSPTIKGELTVTSSSPISWVDTMMKRVDGINYIFGVAMRNSPTRATFYCPTLPPIAVAQVINEDREIPIYGGFFQDDFDGYDVHLYRILSRFPGDVNGDGRVDLDDFTVLKRNFGTTESATWEMGDLNGDGRVDLEDFVILKRNFGVVTVNYD